MKGPPPSRLSIHVFIFMYRMNGIYFFKIASVRNENMFYMNEKACNELLLVNLKT